VVPALLSPAGTSAWLAFGVVLVVSTVTKSAGAGVGLRYHLTNALGFTTLTLMTLVTTAVTGPLVRPLAR
jgi:hypothetical protein